jgi:hypothetical protein
MVTSKNSNMHLLIWLTSLVIIVVASHAEMVKEETSGTNATLLETSIKIGKSDLYYKPAAEHSWPVCVNLSLRMVDLLVPSVTLFIGSSVDAHGVKNNDRMLSATFELCVSPEFWNWYRPSIGVGWFYSENRPDLSNDYNRGLLCSITLVEISPDKLLFEIRHNEWGTCIKPVLSAGTVRFGPIVPWGRRWSENTGNYYLGIELFSAGVVWW